MMYLQNHFNLFILNTLAERVGFEFSVLQNLKELRGANCPRKVLNGKQWNPWCPLVAPGNRNRTEVAGGFEPPTFWVTIRGGYLHGG